MEILKNTKSLSDSYVISNYCQDLQKLNNASKEKDYLERYAKLNDSLGRVRDESINNSVDKITREKEKDDVDQQNSTILYNVIIFSLFFIIIIVYYVYNKRITKNVKS